MYYIVNHTQHIIAADNSLLDLLSVDSIDTLYTKLALGDINFTLSGEEVTITTENGTKSYQIQSHLLSGMLGNITLVEIYPSEEPVEDVISIINDEPITFSDSSNEEAETEEEKVSFDDELLDLISDTEETEEKEIEKISFDDEPFELLSDTEEVEEKEIEKISFDDEPFELLSDTEETSQESDAEVIATKEDDDVSTIIIDIESISQNIGISIDDYNNFLNEYIDTAMTLEKDLNSEEDTKRLNAISTLSHLSNVLHLPVITDIIDQIKDSSSSERNVLVKSLYATLARLSTTPQAETVQDEIIETVKEESNEPIADIVEDKTNNEKEIIEEEITTKGFGTIDLSDVKPIHFDFQMEAAANDLSLPVELIEEFVHDFIEQAHIETKKMLECYEKGDLDTIQKIGHLLKGTASNLRINTLADTLYEIQFCEDSNNLEKLIKEYWGHFLSFETQINLSSNK
jgi:hypothetical protein